MKITTFFSLLLLFLAIPLAAMEHPASSLKDQEENTYDFLAILVDTELPKTPKKSPRKPLALLLANTNNLKRQLFADDIEPIMPVVADSITDFEVLMDSTDLVPFASLIQQQNELMQDRQAKDRHKSKRTRIHKITDLLPHKCTRQGCKKAFAQLSQLTRHSYNHTGEKKPYHCHLCDHSTITKQHLIQHLQSSVHGLKDTQISQLNIEKALSLPKTTPVMPQSKAPTEPIASAFGKSVPCPITGCEIQFMNAKDYVDHVMEHQKIAPKGFNNKDG